MLIAAHAQFLSRGQYDHVIAVEPGVDRLDAVDIHDCRSVHARETAGIQTGFERCHRLASAAARAIRQLGIFELLIFVMLQTGLASAETITVSTQNNEPYEAQVDGNVVGLFSDLVTAAFKKVNVNVVYVFVPWKRAYLMAKDGNADATIPWYKTLDREEDFLFSESVVLTVNKFFIVRDRSIPTAFQWNSVADFKKFRIGGVDGYWYQEEFRKNGIQLDLAMSDRLNVKKLRDGRFDTFVADELIGWYLIGNEFPGRTKEFATLDKPESVCSSHLIAAKRNPKSMALIGEFNRGLHMLIESGEYDRIRRKYAVYIDSPSSTNDLQENAWDASSPSDERVSTRPPSFPWHRIRSHRDSGRPSHRSVRGVLECVAR